MATQQIKGSKRYREAASKVEVERPIQSKKRLRYSTNYPRQSSTRPLNFTAHLAIDPRKSDQMVRGTLKLPHGSGKTVRVIVFTENPEEATAAGAEEAGLDDLIEKVSSGWTEFDVALSTTSAMKSVRKVARVLGTSRLDAESEVRHSDGRYSCRNQ